MSETSRPEDGQPRPLRRALDAREMLVRVVAARDEQALGEHGQAAAILADLEADLSAIVGRVAS